MSKWTTTDEQLATEVSLYLAQVRLYSAKSQWTIGDTGKPWNDFYAHTSALLRKMRTSRRKRVEGR